MIRAMFEVRLSTFELLVDFLTIPWVQTTVAQNLYVIFPRERRLNVTESFPLKYA